MKRILSLLVCLIITYTSCFAMESRIENTRSSFGINKVSYSYMKNGETTYTTDDYTYLAGSVAKGFAAELVLRLKSAGFLTGDESKYGYTLSDILNHRNSLIPYTGSIAGFALDSRRDILRILDVNRNDEVSFNYQNITFLILEEIIEEKTNKTYGEALTEYVLNPLSLYSSGSGYDDFITRWNMYPPYLDGSFAPEYVSRAVCAYEAAAGIFTSAGDLMKWAGHIYKNGRLSGYMENGVRLDEGLYYYNGWYIKDNIAYSTGTILGGGSVCAFDIGSGDGISILASGDSAPLLSLALEYFKEEKTDILKSEVIKYPLPRDVSETDISGEYYNDFYNTLKVEIKDNNYYLTLGYLASYLDHIYGNVYRLSDLGDEFTGILPGVKYIYFSTDDFGNAVSATMECVVTEGSGVFIKQ